MELQKGDNFVKQAEQWTISTRGYRSYDAAVDFHGLSDEYD